MAPFKWHCYSKCFKGDLQPNCSFRVAASGARCRPDHHQFSVVPPYSGRWVSNLCTKTKRGLNVCLKGIQLNRGALKGSRLSLKVWLAEYYLHLSKTLSVITHFLYISGNAITLQLLPTFTQGSNCQKKRLKPTII